MWGGARGPRGRERRLEAGRADCREDLLRALARVSQTASSSRVVCSRPSKHAGTPAALTKARHTAHAARSSSVPTGLAASSLPLAAPRAQRKAQPRRTVLRSKLMRGPCTARLDAAGGGRHRKSAALDVARSTTTTPRGALARPRALLRPAVAQQQKHDQAFCQFATLCVAARAAQHAVMQRRFQASSSHTYNMQASGALRTHRRRGLLLAVASSTIV
mmetsp:Transcript_73417/g.215281  ORF Transcript_73417/g.215281 Transcript_73417/m.215281 type:complete len:218 (-) Transcript_73417:667-1320(-)